MGSFDRKLIVGVETEVGLTTTDFGYFSASELILGDLQFKPNGMRIYYDGTNRGDRDRLEVATAEAPDPLTAVMCLRASHSFAERYLPEDVLLFLNNVDVIGNTWGTHENYLCSSEGYSRAEQLAPHLATRILYTGAGFINSRSRSLFSSRIPQLNLVSSDITTTLHERGLLNTRDEPHAGDTSWRRLHLICGESNILDQANFLKLGTTAIVLKLIEDGLLPVVDLPQEETLDFSKLLNIAPTRILSGNPASRTLQRALEVQGAYLRAAQKNYGSYGNAWVGQLLELWERVLYQIQHEPWKLVGTLDWVTKFWMEPQIRGRNQTRVDSFWATELTYTEHGNGLVQNLREMGLNQPLFSEDRVDRLVDAPPAGTRAQARGAILKILNEDPRVSSIKANWSLVMFKFFGGNYLIDLHDPAQTFHSNVDALRKMLRGNKVSGELIRRNEQPQSAFDLSNLIP